MPRKLLLISGLHAVEEALKAGTSGVLYLSGHNRRTETLRRLAEAQGVRVVWADERTIRRRSGRPDARGALLEGPDSRTNYDSPTTRGPAASGGQPSREGRGRGPEEPAKPDLGRRLAELRGETALILFLDGITDPQNLGAVLRSADQFAVDLVVVTARRSARETETVYRTSAGASAHVPLLTVTNLSRAIEAAKEHGFWVYGADLAGQRVDTMDARGRVALVLGSEGAGLHRLVRERCDLLVRIPAAGRVDSFNVSVAAGILMFEVRRQQGFSALR